MAKYINLTQGQRTLVDDDTFEKVGHLGWYAQWQEHTQSFYAVRNVGPKGAKTTIKLHRVVLGLTPGDRVKCDHENRDTLDNRRENLRPATSSQNACNAKMRSDNSSGFKGVYRQKNCNKWMAAIRTSNNLVKLGYYHDPAMAALAYDLAAIRLNGSFARVNVLTKFAEPA